MTLPSLRVEQHAQILGYAIIGYGVAAIIELIVPFYQARTLSSKIGEQLSILGSSTKQALDFEVYLWPRIIFSAALFVLCALASIVIRHRDGSPKGLGLTLAIVVFGFFPLGTLLSIYILIYLFVIDDGEYKIEPPVHLNG